MSFGVSSTGFTMPTVDDLLTSITADQRNTIADDLDEGAEEVLGQLNGIVALKLREAWEATGAVYESFDPRRATGAALVARCALTGTTPRGATYGTVDLTLTIAAHRTVPAGSSVSAAGKPDVLWTTLTDAVNSSGSPASVTVSARCATAGRIAAPSGTLTVIATPVTGWTAVTNAADAVAGREAETDPELRVRREAELQLAALTPDDAIRVALLAVADVQRVLVVPNSSDAAVGAQPPHSVEVVVQGGTTAAVAAAIWSSVAMGIATYGTTTTTIVDAAGITRTVRFTRPTVAAVYVGVLVLRGATYAGDAALKNALLAVGDALLMGSTVQIADLVVAAMGVAGVRNARVTLSWSSGGGGASDLVPGPREIPTLDSSRISVGYL